MTKNSKANKIIELVPENKSLENSENKIDNPLDKLISQQKFYEKQKITPEMLKEINKYFEERK